MGEKTVDYYRNNIDYYI